MSDNIIGRRKYQALKGYDLLNMSQEELSQFNTIFNITVGEAIKQIEAYEALNKVDIDPKYLEKVRNPKKDRELVMIDKEFVWERFKKHYFESEGVRYDTKSADSIQNLKALVSYFVGDIETFRKCPNVNLLSIPDLKKGLLIMGNYGNGKTSVMRALEKSFIGTNIAFKGYSANELVLMYEGCETPFAKADFTKRIMHSGTRYFDDVLTERQANNYGKANLLKDVIEERYSRRLRTYISCNYPDHAIGNIEKGLEQFGEKYGSRVYDRLFDMFNIVEFTGKSYRK